MTRREATREIHRDTRVEQQGKAMSEFPAKPTILVVDDTPENIDLLCEVLDASYRTKIAVNGEKALKIAFSENKPDLILLDIMMPGMSGYEVCQALKANDATRDIPVIFVTAMSAYRSSSSLR
jgi:putative two-component system response regulator